jgi:hypothetical protein
MKAVQAAPKAKPTIKEEDQMSTEADGQAGGGDDTDSDDSDDDSSDDFGWRKKGI